MKYLTGPSGGNEPDLRMVPSTGDDRYASTRLPYAVRSEVGNENEGDTDEMLRYFRVLLSNKFKILAVAFLGMLAGIGISVSETPVYRAMVSVEIQAPVESALKDQRRSNFETMGDIQTQIRLLKSRSLLIRVRNKLDPSKQAASSTNQKATPEAAGKSQQPEPDIVEPLPQSAPQFSVWRVVRGVALSFVTPSPSIPPRDRALAMAAGTVNVQPAKDARVLDVTCASTDPGIAAKFANTLVEEFVLQGIEKRWETYQRTGQLLNLAQNELKEKLEESEKRLQDYARSNGLIFTGENNNIAEEKLRLLQAEHSRAQSDRISRESLYRLTTSGPPESLPEALVGGPLREYQTRLAELKRQLAELSATLTPSHYKVIRVQAQIDEVEKTLRSERENVVKRIRNDYQAALERERLIAQSYQGQTGTVSGQTEKAIQYNILRREVESNRRLYEATLQKGKEASLESALNSSNVRVVDPARPPRFPYRPNVVMNLAVGFLVGTFLCAAILLLREYLTRSFRAPGETAARLNVPELGVIPSGTAENVSLLSDGRAKWPSLRFLGSNGGKQASNGNPASESVELTTWQKKPSLLADSFRSTLASILFTEQPNGRPRVIVVTSASPGEGKTTVLSNLGIAIAESGQRVLLVDGDMRKPRLNKIYGKSNAWGLSDLLRERTPINDYPRETLCRSTEVAGLYLLSSGSPASDVSPLIHSTRMDQLIERLRTEFDMVLLDTPPMIQMSDARLLSRRADGVILVIRAGKTLPEAAQAALQRLAEDGSHVIGSVLNDWNPKNTAKSHGYSYDYYYKSS